MATEKSNAMTKLNDITECCICIKKFTDPRMLPCIHTFCLQCLQDLTDKSDLKPGDALPCPICRTEFTIPSNGVHGIQKNFFMAGMIEVRNALNQSKIAISCEVCLENNQNPAGEIPEALNRCLVCQENLCDSCCKMHKSFKVSRDHEILKIGDVGDEETVKNMQKMNCDIHQGKILDYYCSECKKLVCVSCFVESHKTHDCKDVKTVEEVFRLNIQSRARVISALAGDLLRKKTNSENEGDFLEKIAERQKEILQRRMELKEMLNEHTLSLLDSLVELKTRHLKEIQTEEEELDRRLVLMESFSSYCDELILKGSDGDVCRSKDELLRRADELEQDHKTYVMAKRVPYDVTFRETHWNNFLRTANGNVVGSVDGNDEFEDFAIAIIGGDDDSQNSDSFKINLHVRGHSEMVSPLENVPNTATSIPAAAVYNNTMFITGIGEILNEIWTYNFVSGWTKCGTLVQGRKCHCAEFIGETLYISGGSKQDIVFYSIEAYNVTTKKTAIIGQLRLGTQHPASVVYKDSVYLFGGIGKEGEALDGVQVVTPIRNGSICLITLSKPMPRPAACMQALLWDIYAILVGHEMCFIFDLESMTWQERPQFRTDSTFFGMVLESDRIFIIGGLPTKALDCDDSNDEVLNEVKYMKASSIVRNETTTWNTYCKLPKPMRVIAFAKLCSVK